MPMRGTLPLVRRPSQKYQEERSLEQAISMLICSPDFAVISAFTTVGIFVSLCFALAAPQDLALVILSTQST